VLVVRYLKRWKVAVVRADQLLRNHSINVLMTGPEPNSLVGRRVQLQKGGMSGNTGSLVSGCWPYVIAPMLSLAGTDDATERCVGVCDEQRVVCFRWKIAEKHTEAENEGGTWDV
jgi:hypothetical protein